MEKIIKNHIKKYFESDNDGMRIFHHDSSCLYPEGKCTCKNIINIENDTSLIKGGILDSFQMVNVLVFIENEFNIVISDKDATPDNFDSINNIVKLIKKYK